MVVTAAAIIIGNEILSGWTQEINLKYIAEKLALLGINLAEARIVADSGDKIIAAVNQLSAEYDYVITTGGIGPTHDDITSSAIASAFKVPLMLHEEAYVLLKNYYRTQNLDLDPASMKMAYLPAGANLIPNKISIAPGFYLENVFVLAGIPSIMQEMLQVVLELLPQGNQIQTFSLDVMLAEREIAEKFAQLQKNYPKVEMGSYPFILNQKHGTSLVLRSADVELLESAYKELQKLY